MPRAAKPSVKRVTPANLADDLSAEARALRSKNAEQAVLLQSLALEHIGVALGAGTLPPNQKPLDPEVAARIYRTLAGPASRGSLSSPRSGAGPAEAETEQDAAEVTADSLARLPADQAEALFRRVAERRKALEDAGAGT